MTCIHLDWTKHFPSPIVPAVLYLCPRYSPKEMEQPLAWFPPLASESVVMSLDFFSNEEVEEESKTKERMASIAMNGVV